jgi:hypothetical protein
MKQLLSKGRGAVTGTGAVTSRNGDAARINILRRPALWQHGCCPAEVVPRPEYLPRFDLRPHRTSTGVGVNAPGRVGSVGPKHTTRGVAARPAFWPANPTRAWLNQSIMPPKQ